MSTTSTLEFSNLPTDAIGKIIEKCDLKEQLTLRKVSKDLRSLVDEQKSAYKSIEIDLTRSFISCVYNGKHVVYEGENWEVDLCFYRLDSCILASEDYVEIASNDLSFALKNPKSRLDDLAVSFGSLDKMNRLGLLLNSLNHQIHVKTLRLHAGSPEYLLSVLPYLKPKVLVNIEIQGVYDGDDWALEKVSKTIEEIASLEQWKQAEQLTTGYYVGDFPAEFLMHFKRFVIYKWHVDEGFLINLRNDFSTSTNFESCTVKSFGLEYCSEYLESFCEKVESGEEVIYRFKIPDDSNKVLEFKLDYYQYQIVIVKKIS